jgi:glyoxylase-like metal-dependent hydrolase (beta-lactamase superfamily II)
MAPAPVVPLVPGIWRIPLLRDFLNGFILRDEDGQVTLVDAHPDHAGGAAHVSQATGLGFDIHADDARYAREGTSPPRDPKVRLGRLFNRFSRGEDFAPVRVERELTDGEVLPVAGGLRVVHTPGHSPGHVSLLHEPTRLLVTGDAIFNVRRLRWPVKSFCTDFAMTQQTAGVLGELDYDLAAFTHGPELRERPREAIRAFLRREGHG